MTPEPFELPARAEVQRRIAELRARIGPAVRLVAVTKGFPVDAVRLALESGNVDVGENYAQELVAKAADLGAGATVSGPGSGGPRWHMIGQLQRNKVRRLAPLVTMWHTVDRVEIIDEIARHAPGATVLIQVDLTGEVGKGGCPPGATEGLVAHARLAGLAPVGLMTVGPTNRTGSRAVFAELRRMAPELGVTELSMGMSDDLDDAVAEGSTIVRVGSAIFGPRPARRVIR